MDAPGNLAEKEFWEDTYLGKVELPARPSRTMPFERALAEALERHAPSHTNERLIELGCAPGRWMVMYAERFGCHVAGVEYTARGAELTRRNLELCGVPGEVHEVDFWSYAPETPFDFVLSLGFIEHFDDVDRAFARHVALVRPGGRLVIGVPNFQGVVRALQRLFDPDWLALHNMEAMGHEGYERRARDNGLPPPKVVYLGGFDPDMISTRARGRRFLAPFWHLRHRGFGGRLNGRWISSYLLLVFDRPA